MSTKVAKRTLTWPLGIALALLLFSGCLKDGDDTIVLPQPDGKIPTYVVPQNLQDSLINHGFDIYEGVEPPNIDGTYIIDPMVQTYTNDDSTRHLEYTPLTFTFFDFMERGIVKYKEFQEESLSGVSRGVSSQANVIGKGNLFTAYCFQTVEKRDVHTGVLLSSVELISLISGEKTNSGILYCKYALIVKKKNYCNGEGQVIRTLNPETYQIYIDGNDMAKNTTEPSN